MRRVALIVRKFATFNGISRRGIVRLLRELRAPDPELPPLTVELRGGLAQIGWIATSTVELEYSEDLVPTPVWQRFQGSVAAAGSTSVATINPSAERLLFRLRRITPR